MQIDFNYAFDRVSHSEHLLVVLFLTLYIGFLSGIVQCDMSLIIDNTLVVNADDSTLLAEVNRAGRKVSAVPSLNRDIARIYG